jgi:site-specific recombinase XerD
MNDPTRLDLSHISRMVIVTRKERRQGYTSSPLGAIYYTYDGEERSVFPNEEPLYSQLKNYYPTWQQEQVKRGEQEQLGKLVAHMEKARQHSGTSSGAQEHAETAAAQVQDETRVTIVAALEDFATHGLANRARASENTRKSYLLDLRQWATWAAARITYVDEITVESFTRYQLRMETQGLKLSTRHRKAASLRVFAHFLIRHYGLDPQVLDAIVLHEVPEKDPQPLKESQYKALLFEAGQVKSQNKPEARATARSLALRNVAILQVLLQTGIRLSELTALTLDDLDLPPERKNAKAEGGSLRVRRKGGDEKLLALNSKAVEAIRAYLKVRPQSQARSVFLARSGEPLTNRAVQKMFKQVATRAGVKWSHVHNLRATHVTYHLAHGTNIVEVQKNTGHRNLKTLQKYAGVVDQYYREAMEKNAL